MNYNINIIKVRSKKPKDTFYTIASVNWILRIFALSNVKKHCDNLVQYWSLTENLIILAVTLTITAYFLVNKIQTFEGLKNNESLKFIDSVQLTFLLYYAEYMLDLFFVYIRRESCFKYLQQYSNIDKILGTPNFLRMRNIMTTAVSCLIVSFLVTSLLDFSSWFVAFGWMPPTLYSLDYVFMFLNTLTILDAVSNVIQIEYRLKVIIDIIENDHVSNRTVAEIKVTELDIEGDIIEDKNRFESYNGIMNLSKCYLHLLEQVNYINSAYGIRIGAFCLNILVNLIHLTNILMRLLLGNLKTPYPSYYLPSVTSILRIINYAAVLHTLVYQCQQAYHRCDEIIRLIDDIVVNKNINAAMKAAFSELRTLVLTRPVRFHGANFFILDYPLLVSLASVIVTYSIIILQSMK